MGKKGIEKTDSAGDGRKFPPVPGYINTRAYQNIRKMLTLPVAEK